MVNCKYDVTVINVLKALQKEQKDSPAAWFSLGIAIDALENEKGVAEEVCYEAMWNELYEMTGLPEAKWWRKTMDAVKHNILRAARKYTFHEWRRMGGGV